MMNFSFEQANRLDWSSKQLDFAITIRLFLLGYDTRMEAEANQEEQRKLLLTMLDAIYVDANQTKSVIAVKPKPPFRPVFQVAAQREKSVIHIISDGSEAKIPSVFLVEAGESRPLPETMLAFV